MTVRGDRRKVKRKKVAVLPLKSKWRAPFPDYNTDKEGLAPTSNSFAPPDPKKDPLEYRWKKGKEEKQSTIEEIERKQGQVAIPYNKGAYQMIIPSDVKGLGRK